MHRSKGLQYRAVAVIGVERGEVPLERVLDRQADDDARATFIELKPNLRYVACTRTRERLLVTGVREMSGFLSGSTFFFWFGTHEVPKHQLRRLGLATHE